MAESAQARRDRINKANVEGLRAMYGKKSAPKKSAPRKSGKRK